MLNQKGEVVIGAMVAIMAVVMIFGGMHLSHGDHGHANGHGCMNHENQHGQKELADNAHHGEHETVNK